MKSRIVTQKKAAQPVSCGMDDVECQSKQPPQFKLASGKDTPEHAIDAPVKSKANGLPEPIQQKMEQSMGADFSNVNIHKNSSEAKDAGAHAFTQGNDIHFAPGQFKTDQKGQELIGHELSHVIQQREGRVQANSEVNGMAMNNDKGLETEADTMGAKAAKGESSGKSGGISSGAASGPVQCYAESELDGVPARISKDLSVALPQSEGRHGLYADQGKVEESNKMLAATGAKVRLKEGGDSKTAKNESGSKNLKKVEPVNMANGTSGDSMEMYADCGRANSMITGSLDRNATYTDLMTGEAQKTESHGDPVYMKYEIFEKVFNQLRTHPEYKDDHRVQRSIKKYDGLKVKVQEMGEKIKTETKPGRIKNYRTLQGKYWDRMLTVYEMLPGNTKKKFDEQLGINTFANPEVGQGYTTSSGGGPAPGMKDNTWNFHWGGVVMKSSDGKDNVTLENFSVNEWDAQNTDWSFQMYGPAEEKGQTWHEQMKDSDTLGLRPTSLAIERSVGGGRRR